MKDHYLPTETQQYISGKLIFKNIGVKIKMENICMIISMILF